MVEHQSKEVVDKISEDLKIQPALDIPRELAEKIQLVYNVNPVRLIQRATVTISDSTTGVIFSASPVKDVYIVGMSLSVAKDVVSTSLFSTINAGLFGETSNTTLLTVRYEPVTVGNITESITFPHPVRLASTGGNVNVSNSTNIASIDTTAIVYFYEVDRQ